MGKTILSMLLFQIILIFLNAVFACAEIAVISFNDTKLKLMAGKGNKRAGKLVALTNQPAKFLATIQVAITLSGFLASAFAAENFSGLIVPYLIKKGVPVPQSVLNSIVVIFITLILSYFTLVFGELVPKRVAMKKAEPLALALSSLLYAISKIFAPVVWLLTFSTDSVLKLLGIDPKADDDEVGEEEIRMMVDAGNEKGTIDADEKTFINNVFEFDNITAGDIVTHRTDVAFLYLEDDVEEWLCTLKKYPHALYPICDQTADKVVGILNTRKFFILEDKSMKNIMKYAVSATYFVPENVTADVLFRNMKKTKNKMAVVLDEYGGMIGIITIMDLIEQLVGDIEEDEYDSRPSIRKLGENSLVVTGEALASDIFHAMDIKCHEDVDERENLNSLVFSELGEVPIDGTAFSLSFAGLKINVTKVRRHRIERAVITKDVSFPQAE